MNATLLLVYISTITLLIATPGPVVALVLNTASRQGLRQGFLTILGTNTASLLLIGAASLIISGLFRIDAELLKWLSLVGCLFIAWLAISSLYGDYRSRTRPEAAEDYAKVVPGRRHSAIINGFLIGISNPKDIIFFVAFFPQFVGITSHVGLSLTVLTIVWIIFDFLILAAYVTLIRGRFFQSRQQWISVISALFLLLVALAGFIYSLLEILA